MNDGLLDALRRHAERIVTRPVTLWLMMLALNGLFQPYTGVIHDARLYAVQVMNRVDPGAYSDDLFFRYGSQDQFSAFSLVTAPLVKTLGIEWAFAIIFLVSSAASLYVVCRLILRLVPDPLAAVIACAIVAAIRSNFGGFQIFAVFESFCTPRLLAVACSLFAIERTLAGRWATAVGALAVGFAVHPLMTFGAMLWIVGWGITSRPIPRWGWFVAGIGLLLGIGFLASPSIATRFLGSYDPEWDQWVRDANAYNFVSEWPVAEWARLGGIAVVLLLVAWQMPDLRRVALLTLGLGIVAVLGTGVAEQLPYALPIQGQPYRALWLVYLLPIPLGCSLAAHWGASVRPWTRSAAVVLVGWLSVVAELPAVWLTMLLFAGLLAWMLRSHSPALGVMIGFALAWTLNTGMQWHAEYQEWHRVRTFDLMSKWLLIVAPTIPLFPWLATFGLIGGAAKYPARLGILAVTIWAGVAWVFGPGADSAWLAQYDPNIPSRNYVRDYLDTHRRSPHPCIYWCGAPIDWAWIDLQSTSFFHLHQLSGTIFNRGTAAEGQRRWEIVQRFETADDRAAMKRMPRSTQSSPSLPTFADLVNICREPQVDWVILSQNFPEGHPDTNGQVYIYDAARIRAEAITDR